MFGKKDKDYQAKKVVKHLEKTIQKISKVVGKDNSATFALEVLVTAINLGPIASKQLDDRLRRLVHNWQTMMEVDKDG